MTDKVNVRKHTRRRTGHAAEFAAKMGYGSDVRVDSYPRRRPAATPRKRPSIRVTASPRVGIHSVDYRFNDGRFLEMHWTQEGPQRITLGIDWGKHSFTDTDISEFQRRYPAYYNAISRWERWEEEGFLEDVEP